MRPVWLTEKKKKSGLNWDPDDLTLCLRVTVPNLRPRGGGSGLSSVLNYLVVTAERTETSGHWIATQAYSCSACLTTCWLAPEVLREKSKVVMGTHARHRGPTHPVWWLQVTCLVCHQPVCLSSHAVLVPQEVRTTTVAFLLLKIPTLKIKTVAKKEVFEANLKSECDLWDLMVKEMWAGKKLADDHKV